MWNYVVVSPSKAAELHDAIALLIPMLKNPDATDEMQHHVAGALAYLARVEEHRAEIAVNPVPTLLARSEGET